MLLTENEKLLELLKDDEFLKHVRNWSNARFNSAKRGPYHIANYADKNKAKELFEVVDMGPTSTLVWRSEGFEVLLDVYGIVANCALPPVQQRGRFTLNTRRPESTLQHMCVIGPSDELFTEALKAIDVIHEMHSEAFVSETLKPLQPTFVNCHKAIDGGTRIITRDNQQLLTKIPIPANIDPHHILQDLQATQHFSYCEHNKVSYYEAMSDESKQNYILVPANPASFRPGQIVEMKVSFKTMLNNNGRNRSFFLTIDSIILLDRMGQKILESNNSRNGQHVKALLAQKYVRKRRGDDDNSMVPPPEKKQREKPEKEGSPMVRE